jgi:hypothetical protein
MCLGRFADRCQFGGLLGVVDRKDGGVRRVNRLLARCTVRVCSWLTQSGNMLRSTSSTTVSPSSGNGPRMRDMSDTLRALVRGRSCRRRLNGVAGARSARSGRPSRTYRSLPQTISSCVTRCGHRHREQVEVRVGHPELFVANCGLRSARIFSTASPQRMLSSSNMRPRSRVR